MSGASVRLGLVLAALSGCSSSGPADLALRLAAPDAELAAHVRPHSGTWVGLTSPGWRSAQMGPFYDVGARLPAQADGTIEIGIGQSPEFMVTLTPQDAGTAAVEDDAGRAVYREAWPKTDLVFVATAKRVEWLLVLADAHAPTSFHWRVTLPPRLPSLRPEVTGALVLADEGGTARLRIPPPYALDARGRRRDAQIDYEDGTLSVRLDTRGLKFPILLDPAIETAVWEPKTSPPGMRDFGGMAYDVARGRITLFGGYDGRNWMGDTWTWDGTAWTLRASTGPGQRSAFAMVYDNVRNVTVLHGGYNGSTTQRDTWEWDGATWTQRATTGPLRSGHGMAYDAARQRTVLFSGNNSAADTWTWNGTTWTQAATTGPPARNGMMMAFDGARQRVVLFAGHANAGGELFDTWEWDGAAWTQVASTGPTGRQSGMMAFDSTRGHMVLYGGAHTAAGSTSILSDTWTWDGNTWTQLAATGPAREASLYAYDPVRDRIVLQGGTDGSRFSDETWEFDGTSWTARVSAPARRQQHVMAYDSVRGKTVLFGGSTSETTSNYLGDTWEWDGTVWVQRATTGPSARKEAGMVFDSNRSRCVLFGGEDSTGYPSETWEWDGTVWMQRATGGPARSHMGIAYDSIRNRTVIFGGAGPLGDTWEWDGSVWTQRATSGPAARVDPAMVFDSARNRTVMFGGYSPAGGGFGTIFGDTWEWNGTTWTQRMFLNGPGRTNHPMAYDSVTGKTVLFGGAITVSPIILGDTYEFDGTSWLGLGGGPSARDNHAMAFDITRRRVVMFGLGNDNINTWEFHAHGGPCASGTQCDTGFCVDSVCCESASCPGPCNSCNQFSPGVCGPSNAGSPGNPSCAPFACDGSSTSCPTSCTSDTTCGTGFFCMGASCVSALPTGQSCSRGRQCQSGFCVGGVCCGSICNGNCQTCTATPGMCTSLGAGAAGTPSCAPYLCNGTSGTCPIACTADSACASPARCVNGRCFIPLPNGSACMFDNGCTSTFCRDGRCCDSTCQGTCLACNRTGALGICGIPVGSDPHNDCTGDPSCGGACNASGGCTYPGTSQTCRGGFCINATTAQLPATCNGQGGCVDNGTADCGVYHCSGNACLTSCNANSNCVPPNVCQVGMCAPLRNLGESCSDAGQCMSGFCASGVCCDQACNGTCQACGANGTCGVAADGTACSTGVCMSGQCVSPPDAAIPPDAGDTPDGGTIRPDAGTTTPDAGNSAAGEGGCSCAVAGRSDPPWLLSALLLLIRRRRAGR